MCGVSVCVQRCKESKALRGELHPQYICTLYLTMFQHPYLPPLNPLPLYPHSQTHPFRQTECNSNPLSAAAPPQLLCIDVQKRISCLAELQDLDYMSDVNWDAVLSKHLPPGFIPNVSSSNKLSTNSERAVLKYMKRTGCGSLSECQN